MHARPKRQPIHLTAATLALAALLAAATVPLVACDKSPDEETKPIIKIEKIVTLPDGTGTVLLTVSAGGRRVGYSYKKDGKHFIVIDGKTEGPFDRVWGPVFSADGETAIIVYRQGREIFKKTIPLE